MALDFNAFEFFKEEIKNENASIKIGAVNKLHLIAAAMGGQKTMEQLVPYLIQIIHEEPFSNDEEFLFSVAKQFKMLAQHMSGHEDKLIDPLEHLAAQEETVIRDEAINSLCEIAKKKPAIVPGSLVPALERLATTNDFFTARVSACSLFPTAYQYATEEQKANLRKAYVAICSDDTPMVRRAAAHKMKDFALVCAKEDFLTDMITCYESLSQEDTQDTIRVASVHTTLVIADLFSAEENRSHTLEVIQAAVTDRSWRVRLTVAKNFDKICKAFGQEIMKECLVDNLVTLLKDSEQEVRKEAVNVIEPLVEGRPGLPALDADTVTKFIFPMLQPLALDPAQPVRATLAQVIGPCARASGRAVTQRNLLPLISDLMKDEFHDVRLNIVAHSGLICEVLSVDGLVHSLLHTIQSLIMDNHWRIRMKVVEQVPKLAKLFGVDMFQSKLEALFLSSLRDSVHHVRKSAIDNIEKLADIFGQQWTVEHLVPKILEQYSNNSGYANRVTTLQVLPKLVKNMTNDNVIEYIIPLLIKATKDSVPNVRFCACRMIMDVIQNMQQSNAVSNASLGSTLRELEHDSDVDVQYYAQRALSYLPAGSR